MKKFTSRKIKRLVDAYKSLELKWREGTNGRNDCEKFDADAEYRQKIAKLEQIVGRLYHNYWRATDLDLRLSNQLFDLIQYLGNYEIKGVLTTIYDFYKNKEQEEKMELVQNAVEYFQNKKENLDIIEEIKNGDKSAGEMLVNEYQKQLDIDKLEEKIRVEISKNIFYERYKILVNLGFKQDNFNFNFYLTDKYIIKLSSVLTKNEDEWKETLKEAERIVKLQKKRLRIKNKLGS